MDDVRIFLQNHRPIVEELVMNLGTLPELRREMPPLMQQCLKLRYVEKKTLGEVSELLQRSISSVRNLHSRTLFLMQRYYTGTLQMTIANGQWKPPHPKAPSDYMMQIQEQLLPYSDLIEDSDIRPLQKLLSHYFEGKKLRQFLTMDK